MISVANYSDFDTGTREGAVDATSSRGWSGHPETYPDVSAPGTSITAACRPHMTLCGAGFEEDTNYGNSSGTSMAAPHTAGIIATLQEAMEAAGQDPDPGVIEDLLEDTAHQFAAGAPYEGDPANPESTTSFDKGHGLVDTTNALNRVFGLAPTEPPPTAGACAPDVTGFTDPEGDADTFAFVGDPSFYDPRLDLTALEVNGDPVAETATFTFTYAEVDG